MWIEKMKSFFKDKTISGINLSEHPATFGSLTQISSALTPKQETAIKNFEKVMVSIFDVAEDIIPEKVTIDNGAALIPEATLYHNCPLRLEALEGISVGGLLGSEWFGQLEVCDEGIFCTFLSEKTPKFAEGESYNGNFSLYFDSNHPLMKMLLKNDFFEYTKRRKDLRRELFDQLTEEQKKEFLEKAKDAHRQKLLSQKLFASKKDEVERIVNSTSIETHLTSFPELLPDCLNSELRKQLKEKYSYDDVILDLFEEVIAPNSRASTSFHDDPSKPQYYWRAIPGGIPAQLINAVKIDPGKNNSISQEMVDKIHIYFPNAVIIDKNNKVLPFSQTKRI